MITRRRFLKSILGLGIAPAIVKADSLMRIYVPKPDLFTFGPGDFTITSWLKPELGSWFHVSLTREANKSKFYLNGSSVEYSELENKDIDIIKISNELYRSRGLHTKYTGTIDDLKIVNQIIPIPKPGNLIIQTPSNGW